MSKNLSSILVKELAANVDFMARLRENVQSGVYRLPSSLLSYISHKYDIPMEELRAMHKEMVDFVLPAVGLPNHRPSKQRRRAVVVHRRAAADKPKTKQQPSI